MVENISKERHILKFGSGNLSFTLADYVGQI